MSQLHRQLFLRAVAFAVALLLTLATFPDPTSSVCLNEKHRPQLHFSPAANWLNDPNGMVYYDGEYHLYYQYHPYSSVWGPMHWGHTSSPDMVHWTEHPIAIYPDPELGTIFSGSAVVDFNNASGFAASADVAPIVAVYTSDGRVQQQSVSYSNDKGLTFQAYEGNPVIPNGDPFPFIQDFRDPKVIEYEPGHWVMVLAAGQEIIFYDTRDLKTWAETGRFGGSPPEGSHGGVWECPDLLRLEFQSQVYWVLLVSINPGGPNGGSATQYFIGHFDGRTFKSFMMERLQWLDYGPDNYAGVTFSNERLQRHIYIGWMNNWGYANELPTAPGAEGGWRGQMTIPRALDLAFVDGRLKLRSTPVPELEWLRNADQVVQLPLPITIIPDVSFPLFGIVPFRNPLLEVDLKFNLAGLDPAAVFVLCFYNALRQEFCVTYERTGNKVNLDRGLSGNIDFSGNFNARSTADRQTSSDSMSVKLFVDTSSVEVFVDSGLSTLTGLFYPDEPFLEANITLFTEVSGSRLVLEEGTIRGLHSIYDCEETHKL